MEENYIRNVFYYKDYYLEFFDGLKEPVKKKFNWTLKLIATIDRVPSKFLKFIEGSSGLYEIRVEVGSDIYRVFCFFDKGQMVILINGFQKKTQKTTRMEIELAEKLKKEYFDEQREKK
jgi:phage-related protein